MSFIPSPTSSENMTPSNDYDNSIKYFQQIGKPSSPLESLKAIFWQQKTGPKIGAALIKNLHTITTEIKNNGNHPRILEATRSILLAKKELEKLPPTEKLTRAIMLMDEAIQTIENRTMCEALNDFVVLETTREQIEKKFSQLLGTSDFPQKESLQAYLQLPGAEVLISKCLSQLTEFREKNWQELEKGTFECSGQTEWVGRVLYEISELGFEGNLSEKAISDVLSVVKSAQLFAVPINLQVLTDGFMIDLFDPSLPAEQTLNLQEATLIRTLSKPKDENGYTLADGGALLQKSGWIEVEPKDILDGNRPFLRGVKQTCLKLNNGITREVRQPLDLTELQADLTLLQSKKILEFVRSISDVYSNEIFFTILNTHKENPLTFPFNLAILNPKHLKMLQDMEGLSEENKTKIIDIALRFNEGYSLQIYKALFSDHNDIQESLGKQQGEAF